MTQNATPAIILHPGAAGMLVLTQNDNTIGVLASEETGFQLFNEATGESELLSGSPEMGRALVTLLAAGLGMQVVDPAQGDAPQATDAQLAAAAAVLDREGRHNGWWPKTVPTYAEMAQKDPIAKEEFEAIVAETLQAALAVKVHAAPEVASAPPEAMDKSWDQMSGPEQEAERRRRGELLQPGDIWYGTHMAHCYDGEENTTCVYCADDICPAKEAN